MMAPHEFPGEPSFYLRANVQGLSLTRSQGLRLKRLARMLTHRCLMHSLQKQLPPKQGGTCMPTTALTSSLKAAEAMEHDIWAVQEI